MVEMKTRMISKVLAGALAAAGAAFVLADDNIEEGRHTYTVEGYHATTNPVVRQHVEWYRDQKLALMVHFGLYALPGIKESWCLVDDQAYWARMLIDWKRGEEFKREYWSLIDSFNPVRFQPEEWADIAARNGFRYAIVTTKHHDGFCLFDTKYTDYKVTNPKCPFSRNRHADIIRAAFDAFRARGLGIACYFSKPDWHHPDYWENAGLGYRTTRMPSYDIKKDPEKWARFAGFVRNQILELVREYGPLDALWLDGGQVSRRNGLDIGIEGIIDEARKTTPGLVAVDRGAQNTCEDVITPELEVPPEALEIPWESCVTMGTGWSYRYDDIYKSPRELIHLLVEVVAKGGNLSLNVGAAPDGRLPQPAVDRMDAMGAWLKKNGEAIYGTRIQKPYIATGYDGSVCYTQKGGALYAIRLWNEGQFKIYEIALAGLEKGVVRKVIHLASGRTVPFDEEGGRVLLHVPADVKLDPYADAFRLERQEADEEGFVSIFNGKDLTGWYGTKYYSVSPEGTLVCDPKATVWNGEKDDNGNLLTEREYRNFILRFDFKMAANGNNGLAIRTPSHLVEAAFDGMCELQLLDDGGSDFYDAATKRDKLKSYQYTGSIYGIVPARRNNRKEGFAGGGSFERKPGEWNTAEAIVVGEEIEFRLNGELITKANLEGHPTDGTTPDGYKHPGLHNPKGHIGWLGHGSAVEWRNIRIRELPDDATMRDASSY